MATHEGALPVAGSEAPPFWYEEPGWQAKVLKPASWVYGAVATWRMDHAKPKSVDVPVLCVGNLTVGGTGKTPTALALAEAANDKGYRPGFLTRGYGGSHIRPHIVDLSHDTARSVGDEPLLLARVAPTVVSQQRYTGAQLLVDAGVDFIIMDDGFQSRNVTFDFALLTVDARRGIGNGHVIPGGPLRAPLKDQLRLADALLRVGDGDAGDAVVRSAARAARPVMDARIAPHLDRDISGHQMLAYAGIGDPEKFYLTLGTLGCRIGQTRSFGDHHVYTPDDARMLLDLADSEGLQLITTEKDHVRLSHTQGPLADLKKRSLVLPVRLEFENKADAATIIERTEAAFHHRRIAV